MVSTITYEAAAPVPPSLNYFLLFCYHRTLRLSTFPPLPTYTFIIFLPRNRSKLPKVNTTQSRDCKNISIESWDEDIPCFRFLVAKKRAADKAQNGADSARYGGIENLDSGAWNRCRRQGSDMRSRYPRWRLMPGTDGNRCAIVRPVDSPSAERPLSSGQPAWLSRPRLLDRRLVDTIIIVGAMILPVFLLRSSVFRRQTSKPESLQRM